jgi:protease-4
MNDEQARHEQDAVPGNESSALERLADLAEEFAGRYLQHHRAETRWRTIKRTLLLTAGLGAAAMYLALYAPLLDPSVGPSRPNVAVVTIAGPIQAEADASAARIVPLIDDACGNPLTRGLILRINSSGGSPSEAERIGAAIRRCRSKRPELRVESIIEAMGASAGYLVATASDTIIANRYALVGSIGAALSTYDASEAAQRFGVTERQFASGALKAGNALIVPNTPSQNAAMQDLVDRVGETFASEVRSARGDRLKDDPELFSGRVWTAQQALELGLIDGVAVLEDHVAETHASLPIFHYRSRRSIHEKLGLQAAITTAVREVITEAAALNIR